MKKLFSFIILILLFLALPTCVFAENLATPSVNNIFGIHITDEGELIDAASLVNSNGGDWGYVTFVITEAERNHDRWQKIFDQMRRLHLIPIVRIATKATGSIWEKPNKAEINNWTAFLNSLNWVVKNRYIIIYNEPNRAFEWGGKVDAKSYAEILSAFSQKLHEVSSDFFVLSAGLDSSAKTGAAAMEESKFIKQMITAYPVVFEDVDGWSSHSYPNGKSGISTFDWELSYLKSLAVKKDLPVFITETGWSNKTYSEKIIGQKLKEAYQGVWNNSKIMAVTPFILNYTEAPFAEFSWKKKDGSFYSFYNEVASMMKIKGQPEQIESGQILAAMIQPIIPTGSDVVGAILARNTGQSIWNKTNTTIGSDLNGATIKDYSFGEIEPGRIGLVFFKAASAGSSGLYTESLYLTGSHGQKVTNSFSIEALIVNLFKTK